MATVAENDANSPCIEEEEDVDVPADIELPSIAVEITLHPSYNILAAGTIDGPVKIFSYTSNASRSNHRLMTFRHHKQSCRAVQFSNCGDYLFSGSSDTSISAIDLNAGAITRRLCTQVGSPIYCLHSIDNYLLASGDDDGRLVIWDFRRELPVKCFKSCEEYISCIASPSDKRTLVVTSGDGSISSYDLRSHELNGRSELFTNEFLAVSILKKDTKVVVGASDGALNIFNFGDWSSVDSRHPFQAGSIDAVVPISDDIVVAGCEDGKMRVFFVEPNRFIGTVGDHDEIPVEGLSVSHDRKFLASCSYDRKVKFHALSVIRNVDFEPYTKPCVTRRSTKFQAAPDKYKTSKF